MVARTLEWLAPRLAASTDGSARRAEAVAVVEILRQSFDDPTLLQLAALACAGDSISIAEVKAEFGEPVAIQLESIRRLARLGELSARNGAAKPGTQIEALRRMTLAMATDIRVVLIRLAIRLNYLRTQVQAGTAPAGAIVRETLEVLSPLANRLGLWQLKWELEDLAFRFDDPAAYQRIVAELEDGREQREQFLQRACATLERELAALRIRPLISGRPKHIYSIHGKMRTKQIGLSQVMDLRAIRIIVADRDACYQVLSLVHRLWSPVPGEFSDYIASPKANGYQSLHTVVKGDDGRPFEIQIRTGEMHRAAEYGLASHWAYKEASVGVAGSGKSRVNDRAQLQWLRQLLAWQAELGSSLRAPTGSSAARLPGAAAKASIATAGSKPERAHHEGLRYDGLHHEQSNDERSVNEKSHDENSDDKESGQRIFVLTPQGRVIELPEHATPVDFAYHVHTDLGHRCRGARVDGQMVPLNTALRNGQTIEIVAANKAHKAIGPSRDWLNASLGYARSNRARAKVRQWFSAQQLEQSLSLGRERVERAMQREGKTALSMEELAGRLSVAADSQLAQGAVLVVGVDLLLTQLARCCRPVPPDPIAGFVTRGRGISVHRQDCKSLQRLRAVAAERIVGTTWGAASDRGKLRVYEAELWVMADDRSLLSRDILDVCARDRTAVSALTTQARTGHSNQVRINLRAQVSDQRALDKLMAAIRSVPGVQAVGRRQASS